MTMNKRYLTPELTFQFKRIGHPEIAADGSFAVASVAVDNFQDNRTQSDLWLFPFDGSDTRQLTFHHSLRPALSPDGKSLAFLSARGLDSGLQLYILPLAGGEARRLTNLPVGISEICWFPDSRSLAFAAAVLPGFTDWDEESRQRRERRDKKSSGRVWTTTPVMDWDRFVDDSEAHIFRVQLDGSAPVCLTASLKVHLPKFTGGALGAGQLFTVHPGGQKLAMVTIGAEGAGVYRSDIVIVDWQNQTAENLTADNPGDDHQPQFSPDGERLIWLRQTTPGFYGDQRRLVVANHHGQKPIIVDHDWDRSLSRVIWSVDSQSLFAEVENAGTLSIFSLALDGGRPQLLSDEESVMGLAGNRHGSQTLIGLRQSFIEPATLVLINPKQGASTALSKLNDDLMQEVQWGRYESVTYPGADGKPIQMWVNYPPDFDPKRKYPLFLLIHGGPHNGIANGMMHRWNAQVFAAMGYITAWHNFHGSSGFGQEFADSITADWADKPYQDTIKATEWF